MVWWWREKYSGWTDLGFRRSNAGFFAWLWNTGPDLYLHKVAEEFAQPVFSFC